MTTRPRKPPPAAEHMRLSYWLALIVTILGAGFWRTIDSVEDNIGRLNHVEAEIRGLDHTYDILERRIELLEAKHVLIAPATVEKQ